VAVSAVAAATSTADTIEGLGRLGAPPWFRQLVALAARQLQVVRADLDRIRLAGAVRGGRSTWSVATRSLGSLFVRSAERAERLQLATELRGGGAPPPAGRPAPTRQWAVALVPGALALAALVVLP
jgi:energy-coupling factor transporter transmembrane protein EcfT